MSEQANILGCSLPMQGLQSNVGGSMQLTDEEEELAWEVHNTVSEFFHFKFLKTYAWMMTTNPMLGGIQPIEMVILGRVRKLHVLVKDAIENNVGIL